jgi:hypothetical protein
MLMNAHTCRAVAEGDRLLDVREELELVLDVLRREERAVRQLAPTSFARSMILRCPSASK